MRDPALTLAPSPSPGMGATAATVVTLTPAPAFDRLYLVDELRPGSLHRVGTPVVRLAGKGVNLTATLQRSGVSTSYAVGGLDPSWSAAPPPWLRIVEVEGVAGRNTVLVDPSGQTTNLNETPRPLTSEAWHAVCREAVACVEESGAGWLVVGGTVPRGDGQVPDLQGLRGAVARAGARLCLDTAGEMLGEWLDRGAHPDLVKPNVHELEDATGLANPQYRRCVSAAQDLRARGAVAALVSLGSDGLLYVDDDGPSWCPAAPTTVRNTTGAGDAALAGFLAHAHLGTERALEAATSWGALTVASVEPVAERLSVVRGPRSGPPPLTRLLARS